MTAFAVNYRGIVVSNRVQLAVIVSIVALLLATIISSLFFVRIGNVSPLLPFGLLPLGTSAALIFWSYLGYENVSNVAEEFENPERDFQRSIMLSFVLISGLYIAVSFVTIGTQAYKVGGGNVAPFAAILSNVLGGLGAAGTAILAAFIMFGTVNAYTTGTSRVFYAVARDGGFPRALDHINAKTKVPDRALLLLIACVIPVTVAFYFLQVDLETALLIPSGATIFVYIIGSAAGVKILRNQNDHEGKNSRRKKFLPWISLIVSIVMAPFVGELIGVSLVVVAAALLYVKLSKR